MWYIVRCLRKPSTLKGKNMPVGAQHHRKNAGVHHRISGTDPKTRTRPDTAQPANPSIFPFESVSEVGIPSLGRMSGSQVAILAMATMFATLPPVVRAEKMQGEGGTKGAGTCDVPPLFPFSGSPAQAAEALPTAKPTIPYNPKTKNAFDDAAKLSHQACVEHAGTILESKLTKAFVKKRVDALTQKGTKKDKAKFVEMVMQIQEQYGEIAVRNVHIVLAAGTKLSFHTSADLAQISDLGSKTGEIGGVYRPDQRTIFLPDAASISITPKASLVHEVTHAAKDVLYGNDCAPYPQGDSKAQRAFKKAFAPIDRKIKECTSKIEKDEPLTEKCTSFVAAFDASYPFDTHDLEDAALSLEVGPEAPKIPRGIKIPVKNPDLGRDTTVFTLGTLSHQSTTVKSNPVDPKERLLTGKRIKTYRLLDTIYGSVSHFKEDSGYEGAIRPEDIDHRRDAESVTHLGDFGGKGEFLKKTAPQFFKWEKEEAERFVDKVCQQKEKGGKIQKV